jgi:GGDEF domain-containing protein
MAGEALLGRVLTDPVTGLPNLPYFRLIRDWEERRGHRRHYRVAVLRLTVSGGGTRGVRSLPWRLCQELRDSDLIAAEDLSHYRVLLTSPDAEHIDAVADRIRRVVDDVNRARGEEPTIAIRIDIDEREAPPATDPCDPCRGDGAEESGEGPTLEPGGPRGG